MAIGSLDTMDGFLIRLLIPVYIMISLSLVISHAAAVEPPRMRTPRDMKGRFKMAVNPTEINFHYGETISVACKAKGGRKIKQTPLVSFHWQYGEFTTIPISTGFPGVLIQPVSPDELKDGENRVKTILTLGKSFWEALEIGPNHFSCKASDLDGNRDTLNFVINKLSGRRDRSPKIRRGDNRRPCRGRRCNRDPSAILSDGDTST